MFSQFFQKLLDCIAPKKCYSCKKEGHFLCDECTDKLVQYSPYCYVCKKPSEHFRVHTNCTSQDIFYDQVIVFTHYRSSNLKKLLHDGKYYGKKEIYLDISPFLASLLTKNYSGQNAIISCPPMHIYRKLFRGYNQSQILAQHIGKYTSIACDFTLLKKAKQTVHQSHLGKKERIQNLIGTFQVTEHGKIAIKDATIILVDDVISTGSTLNECAKQLKKYGAKQVIGLIIASD